MGFAEAVDCPVILVADIDRGGVFAHLTGTLDCLSASERARVVGFVINRFAATSALLQGGLDWLEAKTGKPVLAVLPYLHRLMLDAEDASRPRTARRRAECCRRCCRASAITPTLTPARPPAGGLCALSARTRPNRRLIW